MNKIVSFICFFLFIAISYSQNIFTVAGTGNKSFSGDGGKAILADIGGGLGIAVSPSGSIIFSDNSNNRVREINSSGIINTIAGTGAIGYNGVGSQAILSSVYNPNGIAIDVNGNIYIADYQNTRIRKINPSGIISTIAGNGFSGDGGLAINAQINDPAGIAVDANGNIYFVDQYRIRKINNTGIIQTIAGTGVSGFSGDGGPAVSAQFASSSGIAVDAFNNVYFTDDGINNRIRKINSSGIISTICGTGVAGFSGDGGNSVAAKINTPVGIAIDGSGNIYFNDVLNSRIRKINSLGIINTICGTGTDGFSGDGGPAVIAQVDTPYEIVVDIYGNLILQIPLTID